MKSVWSAIFICVRKILYNLYKKWHFHQIPAQGWDFLLWFQYSPTACAWSLGRWKFRLPPNWSGYALSLCWNGVHFYYSSSDLNSKMVFLDVWKWLVLEYGFIACHLNYSFFIFPFLVFIILFAFLISGFNYTIISLISFSFAETLVQ